MQNFTLTTRQNSFTIFPCVNRLQNLLGNATHLVRCPTVLRDLVDTLPMASVEPTIIKIVITATKMTSSFVDMMNRNLLESNFPEEDGFYCYQTISDAKGSLEVLSSRCFYLSSVSSFNPFGFLKYLLYFSPVYCVAQRFGLWLAIRDQILWRHEKFSRGG